MSVTFLLQTLLQNASNKSRYSQKKTQISVRPVSTSTPATSNKKNRKMMKTRHGIKRTGCDPNWHAAASGASTLAVTRPSSQQRTVLTHPVSLKSQSLASTCLSWWALLKMSHWTSATKTALIDAFWGNRAHPCDLEYKIDHVLSPATTHQYGRWSTSCAQRCLFSLGSMRRTFSENRLKCLPLHFDFLDIAIDVESFWGSNQKKNSFVFLLSSLIWFAG